MTNIIMTTGGIQGNISNCEIETILTNPGKTKAFQFTQTESYSVVNKCDNTILSKYESTGFTVFGVIIIFLSLLFVAFILDLLFGDHY